MSSQLTSITLRSLAGLALAAAAVGPAAAEGVRHLPPAEATAGEPLSVTAAVARASERTLRLHYRPVGTTSWSEIEFQRAKHDWVAVVPAEQVGPPGVEYFIDSTSGDATVPEFASQAAPHRVGVYRSSKELRRARDLERTHQRRSRIQVRGDYVDFGARSAYDTTVPDRYYRVDADFSYRLLSYPLEEIRFGYTALLGTTPNSALDLPGACSTTPDSDTCRKRAGFKAGGWFELGLGLTEGIRADLRAMVMANQDGFAPGGRLELRTGVADGNHVAIGAELMAAVGASGFFRLGWHTVPAVPMAATIEVTNLPASLRSTGVRLIYDAYYPMPNGVRLGLRIGYAARDQHVGGPTAGLSASVDF